MVITGDDPEHLNKIVKAYAKTLKGMSNAFDREYDQTDIPITQSSWEKILSDYNAVSDEDGKTAMQALIDSAKGGLLVMDLSDDTAVLLNGPAYTAAYDLLVDYLLDSSTWAESPVVIFTGRQSQIESVFKNDRLLDTLFEANMRFSLGETSRVSITPAPQRALPSRAPVLKRRPKL